MHLSMRALAYLTGLQADENVPPFVRACDLEKDFDCLTSGNVRAVLRGEEEADGYLVGRIPTCPVCVMIYDLALERLPPQRKFLTNAELMAIGVNMAAMEKL